MDDWRPIIFVEKRNNGWKIPMFAGNGEHALKIGQKPRLNSGLINLC
jgi:hypothetical protein